jgi:hypothetical protein
VVCPACGVDPLSPLLTDGDLELGAAIEDGEAFAETPLSLEIPEHETPSESEVDYAPDADLLAIIADGEELWVTLMDGPILVAGNEFIN